MGSCRGGLDRAEAGTDRQTFRQTQWWRPEGYSRDRQMDRQRERERQMERQKNGCALKGRQIETEI